ncbi:flagellar export protein FliJ [Bartonella sp. B10834G6]|uniref:Flagellar export protein FliJ n=1 Tax=Bartonella apis TaxID=1686310 RepID=A0A1R0F9V8_9HYPH|nr:MULTISPECIES: flagellar export protein FliJ [Bartonella]MBH9982911.1 flagellar export protein FliJ [Bartonella apis]MBH9987491.1 flagellar export protein FliJ [Bartonella apis]MBI0168694.1 flagellar export protein FliJ [Bartonella sp. W8167]MBI0171500.1 flagellar export protein FliJ [Bartonella sp. W8151]MBI0175318.1 flagellar export protein FliJ [Bartonella apis]
MKPRESVVRLKMFQVREKRRQISQLDMMMGEFNRMASELEAQIVNEERKSGITDVNHFAYPTFARAARQRRENLMNSIRDLQIQKASGEMKLHELEAELERAKALEERDGKALPDEDAVFVQSRSMIG